MFQRRWLSLWLALVAVVASAIPVPARRASACCPAPPQGRPVVNADQTVVIVWDAATKTEHFVRRASFKADADDFGFLIPTPNRPALEESGDGVFPALAMVTAPRVVTVARPSGGGGCGCSHEAGEVTNAMPPAVTVLEDKVVAGFHAVVLEARSVGDLTEWLKANGYAFSPQVRAWAEPYVAQGWKITALKVAKADAAATAPAATAPTATSPAGQSVATAALRMSFQTDRPLFPYREPDPAGPARALGATHRLLRIYFLGEARYQGELTPEQPWTGRTAWAGRMPPADRERALDLLKLPGVDAGAQWWLTEFEDDWPYRAAPGDLWFSLAADQTPVERPPVTRYAAAAPFGVAEAAPYVLAVALCAFPKARRSIGRRRN